MEAPVNSINPDAQDQEDDEEIEEITVDVTEEGMVWVQGGGWDIVLSPEEARMLAEALNDAAADAETPAE